MNRNAAFALVAALALAGGAGVAMAQAGGDIAVLPADRERGSGPPPAPPPITASSRPGASGGEALYVEYCIMCHGPTGMGTGLLERAGRPQPMLEMRSGMPAAFFVTAARNGIGNMPAIPRGEVSDEQLQAIAEYLAAGPHPRAGQ
ncbi:MAG: cytochrome c [Alteraurantiacibacter sp.]|nr:cytochrome c [Alteraurantiacibacter sp.]